MTVCYNLLKIYENLSPEQIQRREFLESKKKWISKEDFHRHFGLRTTSIKPIVNIIILLNCIIEE